jgi:hypothetical protein
MKTPMEELIEIIKKRQEDDEAMPFMYNDKIIALAESMLEKEKEVIINAYWDGGHDVPTHPSTAEQYYNEIFKTKER